MALNNVNASTNVNILNKVKTLDQWIDSFWKVSITYNNKICFFHGENYDFSFVVKKYKTFIELYE